MRRRLLNIKTKSQEAIMYLSYNPTTELDLLIQTASGDDWEIDWGDGVWEQYASSTSTYRTKTFGTATSGIARVRSATGRELDDFRMVKSNVGTWSFDAADLYANHTAEFRGDLMQLTGDAGDIKATFRIDFRGDLMEFTGDVGGIKASNYARLQGDSITLTGDVGTIKISAYAYFIGNSMELTYTTTTWTTIISSYLYLDLAPGHLTSSEISQMLIDMDASGITGTATLDFRYNNGAPNGAGETAADNLRAKGYTVLTN